MYYAKQKQPYILNVTTYVRRTAFHWQNGFGVNFFSFLSVRFFIRLDSIRMWKGKTFSNVISFARSPIANMRCEYTQFVFNSKVNIKRTRIQTIFLLFFCFCVETFFFFFFTQFSSVENPLHCSNYPDLLASFPISFFCKHWNKYFSINYPSRLLSSFCASVH